MNLTNLDYEDLTREISFIKDLIYNLRAHRDDLIRLHEDKDKHCYFYLHMGIEWTESRLEHEEDRLHQYLCEIQLRTTERTNS